MNSLNVPDEWVEYQFLLVDGDNFTVDAEIVEVDYVDSDNQFREDKVKRWTLSDGDLSRELTEYDVVTIMPRIKDEYRDTAKALTDGSEVDEESAEE